MRDQPFLNVVTSVGTNGDAVPVVRWRVVDKRRDRYPQLHSPEEPAEESVGGRKREQLDVGLKSEGVYLKTGTCDWTRPDVPRLTGRRPANNRGLEFIERNNVIKFCNLLFR